MSEINPKELSDFEQKLRAQHDQLTATFEDLQQRQESLGVQFREAKTALQEFRDAYGDVIAAFERRASKEGE